MPAALTHAHSVGDVHCSPKVEVPNLTRTASAKKRVRRKSSPKKVRMAGNVYLKHNWSMHFEGFDENECKSKLGAFNTIQGFWRYYNQIVDPTNFPNKSNLSIFKENPTLPGAIPKKVCKWTIPTSKSDTGKVWMKVVLQLIGEQFAHSTDIAGVSLSVYPVLDNIILWGTDCSNSAHIEEITTQLRKLVENDTVHILSYQKITSSLSSSQENVGNSFGDNRSNSKFSSSIDLIAEEQGSITPKHKKSSSFSNSQFPDMSTSYRRHRKTKSDAKKSVVVGTRKSISFSSDVINPSTAKTSTVTTNQLSNKRMSLLAQMYNNGPQNPEPFQIKQRSLGTDQQQLTVAKPKSAPASTRPQSSITFSRIMQLFILVVLVLSGFLFTK